MSTIYYDVGPGKTFSTISGAATQMWTDEGYIGAPFTQTRHMRVYGGTQSGVFGLNNLAPTATNLLIVEGIDSPTIDGLNVRDGFNTSSHSRVFGFNFINCVYTTYTPGGNYATVTVDNSGPGGNGKLQNDCGYGYHQTAWIGKKLFVVNTSNNLQYTFVYDITNVYMNGSISTMELGQPLDASFTKTTLYAIGNTLDINSEGMTGNGVSFNWNVQNIKAYNNSMDSSCWGGVRCPAVGGTGLNCEVYNNIANVNDAPFTIFDDYASYPNVLCDIYNNVGTGKNLSISHFGNFRNNRIIISGALVLSRSKFFDNYFEAGYHTMWGNASNTDVLIYNNVFKLSGSFAAYAPKYKIYNNTFIDSGVVVFSLNYGGSYGVNSQDWVIKNNIIYTTGSTSYFIGTGHADNLSSLTTSNNCYYPSGTIVYFATNPAGGYYNNLAAWQAIGQDANSVQVDPQLVGGSNLYEEAYKINHRSPARRMGTDLSAVFTTDLNGAMRRVPWTIGAFQGSRDVVAR